MAGQYLPKISAMLASLLLYLSQSSVSAEPRPALTASGCGHVQLVCEEGSMMVVREASFTPVSGGVEECEGRGEGVIVSNNQDIWRAVVGRCNGDRERECVFDMGVDLPESSSWGRGRTDVRYSCEKSVHSYCGGRVDGVGEGYISSPGYPRYYLGGRECVWTMVVEEGQKIQLELADLSLRETREECEDSVSIKEDGRTLLSLCGGLSSPVSLLSATNIVEVRMRTAPSRQQLYPRRGLLLHYTVQGCATPPAIAEGETVKLNTSLASLQCNTGHVLQSTLSPVAIMHCSSTTWTWTPPVEHCVSVQFLLEYGNKSVVRALSAQYMKLEQKQPGALIAQYMKLEQKQLGSVTEWKLEVMATILVGCLLVVSATIAICILHRARKIQTFSIQAKNFHLENADVDGIVDRY